MKKDVENKIRKIFFILLFILMIIGGGEGFIKGDFLFSLISFFSGTILFYSILFHDEEKFQRIGLLFLSFLMILGGLQILFGGFLEHTSASNSIFKFNGIERIIGIIPIFLGSLFIYFIRKRKE